MRQVRRLANTPIRNVHETYRHQSPLEPIPLLDSTPRMPLASLQTHLTQTPGDLPQMNNTLKFGAVSTDHQLEIDFQDGQWEAPQIVPFRHLAIHPFSSSLHYAVQCFEGMKAIRDQKGNLRLFRPELNMHRFRRSCLRISLPDFAPEDLLHCLETYVRFEERWVPKEPGFSLYLRPTGISTGDTLGVRAADKAKIFVVSAPVGPYYAAGFKPISLYCDHQNIRAAPLGIGAFKLGSNYGPTIALSKMAEQKGYEQIMWLYGSQILEVGTSNIFIFWKNKEGEQELVTPKADDLILHGVTRDSVIGIAEEMGRFKVVQRNIDIQELIESVEQGRVLEMFSCGTAVTIGPVDRFKYKDTDYKVPIDPKLGAGPLAKEISDRLTAIQTGVVDHPWSKVIS